MLKGLLAERQQALTAWSALRVWSSRVSAKRRRISLAPHSATIHCSTSRDRSIRWYAGGIRHRRPKTGGGAGRASLPSSRRSPATEQDGQLHHGFAGRRSRLVRGGLPHLRVRSLDQGHGADDSGYRPPRGSADVRRCDRARHDGHGCRFCIPDCDSLEAP